MEGTHGTGGTGSEGRDAQGQTNEFTHSDYVMNSLILNVSMSSHIRPTACLNNIELLQTTTIKPNIIIIITTPLPPSLSALCFQHTFPALSCFLLHSAFDLVFRTLLYMTTTCYFLTLIKSHLLQSPKLIILSKLNCLFYSIMYIHAGRCMFTMGMWTCLCAFAYSEVDSSWMALNLL